MSGAKETPRPWLVTYAHDRRTHRHRCQLCRKIVNAGEPVWMARVANRTTRVLHAKVCADSPTFGLNGATQLELLSAHQIAHLDKSLAGEKPLVLARAAVAAAKAAAIESPKAPS